MRKLTNILLTTVFLLTLIIPTNCRASYVAKNPTPHLVRLDNDSTTEETFSSVGVFEYEKIDSLGIYRINIDETQRELLEKNPNTAYIERDNKVETLYVPQDEFYGLQTYLADSNIKRAWNITKGSSSVVVAVIDTGVDYNHEDLVGTMWRNSSGQFGYDFVNGDTDPMDDHYHGTVVAGIIAAKKNNGIGIAGIANIKIMSVKSMTSMGDGFVSDIAQSIRYAADNGANLINLSLGLPKSSITLDEAVNYAYLKGTLTIAATGNRGVEQVDNPARNSKVIGVGAVNKANTMADYSNYGTGTDIVAIGDEIYSTSWSSTNSTNLYKYNMGTSFATPQVTGTAALLLSKDPTLTPDQLRKRILGTTTKLPAMDGVDYNTQYGYGKLNAYSAITYDKIAPSINLSIYNTGSSTYRLIGEVKDDNGPSSILPQITSSNIDFIRVKVDNQSWQTLNHKKVGTISVDLEIPGASRPGQNITIETQDTSGNKTTKIVNTSNSLVGTVSNDPFDYQAQLVHQSPYPRISTGDTYNMKLSYRNTGNTIWTKDNIHLGTSSEIDRLSSFADPSWLSPNRIEMTEEIVAPSEVANFEFTITAPPNTNGTFHEYFNLVAEKITWFRNIGLFWEINVEQPSYHAQYIGQSPFENMTPGSTRTIWVEYRNVGTQSWGWGNVHLGTSSPLDRESIFYSPSPSSGWKSKNRIRMEEQTVNPGETVKFKFTIQAPQTSGTYNESFRPVADGVGWMEDVGLYWQINVQ